MWSLIRIWSTLLENKSIHRNRENRIAAERELRIQRERRDQDQGCYETITNFFKDSAATIKLKVQYIVIPMIKVLPSVIFRLLTFWLILSYCTEFYPNEKGNGPGMGLLIPAFLLFLIGAINFLSGYSLGLNKEEAIVNSFSNLIMPLYVDLFSLVSA